MKNKNLKIFFISLLTLMTLSIIGLIFWALSLDKDIQNRLAQGWFLPPIEIYSAHQSFKKGMILSPQKIERKLQQFQLRQRQMDQPLLDGDWLEMPASSCVNSYSHLELNSEQVAACFLVNLADSIEAETLIVVDTENVIARIVDLTIPQDVESLNFPPVLFAQYYNEQPILRSLVQVGQVPLQCLQAVTAIEDSQFLEHKGVSLTGTLRAVYRNLTKARFAEGGSTITQQLVKNYFLSGEKTIRRKLTEQIMAILLEARSDKDTILQNYLNVIYMGANGPFQVRGFGAASKHYFNKDLETLNLSECALLAAMINSPGRYNPFSKPENAQQRRELVLQKMLELNMIAKEEFDSALQSPLPQKPPKRLTEPAPYFVQAINKQLANWNIDAEKGLKVYTTLDIDAQEAAQTLTYKYVNDLESWYESLKKKKAEGKELQAAMIVVDLSSAEVLALVGGRTFKDTQFNRITDAHRQVGSIMKPFVYLAALESMTESGDMYSPLTVINDSPFEYKYEGQSWSPQNYDGTFNGPVPLFYALKSSLNSATAQLGLKIGLSSIVDVARRFGIESSIQALPSLTLGAFELTPWEVARAYTAIANFGKLKPLSLIRKILNSNGTLLYENNNEPQLVTGEENAATLVGMMKQTLISGTAKGSQKMGFTAPAAGKTGTTSDTKDAWFAGFTPQILTLVWVGYDDNTPMGLTGASGALPLWVQFMKAYGSRYQPVDFTWPEGTHTVVIRSDELSRLMPQVEGPIEDVELILRSSDETFDR
ncbi:MAG: PBP1A family penicillin-binding protein [Bdellovibrionales bacterium]|nr:PBP1A family penicillin-binding protein [Bdellovibrionales bacterium]